MKRGNRMCTRRVITLFVLALMFTLSTLAVSAEIHISNSKDWKDVYSVMLYATLQGDSSFFLNSESLTSITRLLGPENEIIVYEADGNGFIGGVDSQLSSAGYPVQQTIEEDSFNTKLLPDVDSYILVSEDNYRTTISLAPYAVQTNSWVFIVGEDNIDEVIDIIDGADDVLSIGNFRRDLYEQLEPYITETINNNNVYKDSQDIARRFSNIDNVVLADGSQLEAEFFTTKSPVLLAGFNKILDETHDFLTREGIKSVVIVGNKLAVVGEQIRTKSNKKISVFVKYGQTSTNSNGEVYALMMFPFPQPTIGLTITETIYNPKEKQLITYFENKGNIGLNQLSTIKIVDENNQSLGDASDALAVFIAAGEIVPVVHEMDLPADKLDTATAIYYTSFGTESSQLDTFLTMVNKYGPPFSIPVTVQEIEDDNTNLVLGEVAYYSGLKRVGVELTNDAEVDTYYSLRLNRLIVNGLETDLTKDGIIEAGKTETIYLSVELDEVDRIENEVFNVVIIYGAEQDYLLKSIKETPDFITTGGGLISGLAVSVTGQGSLTILVIVLVLIVGARIYFKRKKKNSTQQQQQQQF